MTDTPRDPAAVWFPVHDLHAWAGNYMIHGQAQLDEIKASISRNGWGSACVAQTGSNRLIIGHGRVAAMLQLVEAGETFDDLHDLDPDDADLLRRGYVPVRFRPLPDDRAAELAIADNEAARMGERDDSALARVVAQLAEDTRTPLDVRALGMERAEIERIKRKAGIIPDPRTLDVPPPTAPPSDPVSVRGEVYQLGPHRVMCGDSAVPGDVAQLMGGDIAELFHLDPPYGMGKEADGVANDNLYDSKLDAFLLSVWLTYRPHLADNASGYAWGASEDLWRWWYGCMVSIEPMDLRNEIVWDKGSGQGMGSAEFRSYATASERCLFWMLGNQGHGNVNADDYWEGWEPIRAYLAGEVHRMDWGVKDVKRICGVGMFSHWFSKSQWTMIPEKHYTALQIAANGKAFNRPYTAARGVYTSIQLSDEHQTLQQEFQAGRSYFDNAHEVMNDVWKFPRVKAEERHGHATPKPIEAMERIVRSSAQEHGLVVEPYGGSGTTLMACAKSDRVCYTMELLPQWVDVIRKRWTAWAEAAGVDAGSGALR